MLGNFSFGDYFKKEAIAFAHELVTERYGIDHDRLWVTVFETDEEAVEGWSAVGLAPERIVRRGKVDEHGEPANFWWTHKAGPCGPCSEIFVDRGPQHGPDGGPDVDEDRFCEIWNLVFMQDECDDDSNVLHPLPKQNIDTGSSLERVAMVLQDVNNVFETDLLRPLLAVAEELTGRRYGADPRDDVSLRVMAEHGRATTFLIADGVLPSNEGRGYTLRRELRRLITYARRLGVDRPVMGPLIESTAGDHGRGVPRPGGQPRVHPAGGRVGGGAVRLDVPARHDAVRGGGRPREGVRVGDVPGRGGVPAARHVRVPAAAHRRSWPSRRDSPSTWASSTG